MSLFEMTANPVPQFHSFPIAAIANEDNPTTLEITAFWTAVMCDEIAGICHSCEGFCQISLGLDNRCVCTQSNHHQTVVLLGAYTDGYQQGVLLGAHPEHCQERTPRLRMG